MDEDIDYDALLRLLREEVPPRHFEAVLEMAEAFSRGEESHLSKHYKSIPEDFETFVRSPDFMDMPGVLYDVVMDELIELNTGKYTEAVLTGGIGSGKTTIALYTTAYQLYLLSCYKNPHEQFGLDPSSEIQFVFQSIHGGLAKQVDYNRFRSMIEAAPYFQRHFKFDKDIESKLVFPNRIELLPISGLETAAIGQNVIGGVIDEMNYMAVIEGGKSAIDGGVYNQAIALYNSIARRRKSRFMRKGKMPGILCLVSSKRYPGQFTDEKELERQKEIDDTGSSTIYLYDKRSWDIKPDDYGDEVFHVFVGDESRKPRIMIEGEKVHIRDRNLVMAIPTEHKYEFEKDILNALREVAGISTLARNPFLPELEAVIQCFGGIQTILSANVVDFDQQQLNLLPGRMKDKDMPRFAHVDLGVTGDSAGIAMGYVDRFTVIGEKGSKYIMPNIVYDFLLEVKPPRNGEIQFWKIRRLFEVVREYGIPLTWITYDSFQSTDSLQLLRQSGFITGNVSMDKSMLPYDILKTAIYDGRMHAPRHKLAQKELSALERDLKTGKIDHPPGGSKDVADAMAGVAYGLTMRRKIWIQHGIPLGRIPESLKDSMEAEQRKDDKSYLLRRK